MKFKRTLSALASVALLFGILILPSVKSFAAVYNEVKVNAAMQKQAAALDADAVYNRYIDSVYERDAKAANGISDYPDWHCARWIDDDGKLHIAIREDDKEAYNSVEKAIADCKDSVILETMQYSFNELQQEAELLADKLRNSGYLVSSYNVEQTENCIKVALSEEDFDRSLDDRIALITESTYQIMFCAEPLARVQSTELVAGKGLKDSSPYSAFTLSACGIYKGKQVAVTAGHCLPLDFMAFDKTTGKRIGRVVYNRFSNGCFGDFAFINIGSSDFRPSHRVHYGGGSIQTFDACGYDTPAKGTRLKKFGTTTGLSQELKVINERKDATILDSNDNPVLIKALVETRIVIGNSFAGDSGGPYWVDKDGARIYYGVHCSAAKYPAEHRTLFTPYKALYAAGFRVFSDHRVESWHNYNSSVHSAYCTLCETTVYESHMNHLNPTGTKCMRCGRTGPFNGTNGFMPFPAEHQMDTAPFCGHDHN